MDLAELKSTVSSGLSGQVFSLAASALGSPSITSLWTSVFLTPTLALGCANVTNNDTGSEAEGTLTGAPQTNWSFLSGMQVTATFTLDSNGDAQVTLQLVPGATPWTLPTTMSAWSSGLFGKFTWSSSQINFDSAAPELLPASFPTGYGLAAPPSDSLATGLALTQAITYSAAGAALKWLLGSNAITLAGPTAWDAALPEMDLVSTGLPQLTAGDFSFALSVHALAVLEAASASDQTLTSTPYLALTGTLGSSNSSISVPVNTIFGTDPLTSVTITADYGNAGSFALSDIADFVGTSLDSQMPSSFPTLAGLTLSPVVVVINPSGPAVDSVTASVGLSPKKSWPSDNAVVRFQSFIITFAAAFVSSPTAVTTTATATATVGTGTLDAELDFPGAAFSCTLAAGSTIDITALINQITGNQFSGITLLCTALSLTGNISDGTYSFDATVDSTSAWSFPISTGSDLTLGLTSVAFAIAYSDPASGKSSVSGSVTAQLVLDSATTLALAADLPASGSWTFTGATTGAQTIALSTLVGDVSAKFGLDVTTPSIIFTLTSLNLEVAAGSPLTFCFTCDTILSLAGIENTLTISLGRDADATTFTGTLVMSPATFTVDFTSSPGSDSFTFALATGTSPLTLQDVATYFGLGTITLPEGLNPTLVDAQFVYDSTADSVAFSATLDDTGVTGQAGFVTFLSAATGTPRVGVFALDLVVDISLSSLRVVGQDIPAALDPGIDTLQVVWASQTLDATDQATFATAWTAVGGIALPSATIDAGVTLGATLTVGTDTFPLCLPLSTATTTQSPALTSSDTGTFAGQARWFPVGKSLGPLTLGRIGIEYSEPNLYFLFDASLALSILSVGLDGLGLGTQIKRFKPSATLDGLSLTLSDGPVSIAGGLLNDPNPPSGVTEDWIGEVTIAIAPYLIIGMAGFAKVDGAASFFAFAQIEGDFGGPPAFFVTGFMGGFGYNSTLSLPTVDQVASFPFLTPATFGAAPTPASVLSTLSGSDTTPAWVTPTVGEDWAAAGILFRSFELIIGQALVIADFGKVFEIALVGTASMSLPQGETTQSYAFIELEIEAVLDPAAGTFSIAAALTDNSFVITQDCVVTGGFSFCLWFGSADADPHTGDFVVTVGGYHPAFVVPAWYPQVARLGFNWQVDSNLSVQGGAYFALTPSAAMAGGNLQMLFQSGSLQAWFTAYCDLLIRWQPFSFTASIGISVGASYTLNLVLTSTTVSVELSATLNLFGPPTGGSAYIDWSIISFTIPFGASQSSSATSVDWLGFQSLLPGGGSSSSTSGFVADAATTATATTATPAVLGLSVQSGLFRNDSTLGWVVRLANFSFTAVTALPATSLVATADTVSSTTTLVNIRPMALAGVTSVFTVTLTSSSGTPPFDLSTWSPVAQQSNLPEALYGAPLASTDTPAPAANLISGLLTGLQFAAPPATPGALVGPFLAAGIVEPLATGNLPLSATVADPLPVPAADSRAIPLIISTLGQGAALAAQQACFAALGTLGVPPPTSDPLTQLAGEAGILLAQNPLVLPSF